MRYMRPQVQFPAYPQKKKKKKGEEIREEGQKDEGEEKRREEKEEKGKAEREGERKEDGIVSWDCVGTSCFAW